MTKRASKSFTTTVFVFSALLIAFALIHSSMPAGVSDGESIGIAEYLTSFFKSIGVNIEITNHFLRKTAHFTEYTAMGMLFTLCAYSFNRLQPYRYTPQVLFAGLLTAVADETVQLFADGRAGMLEDVWLDFAGVITGFALMLIFCLLIVRRRKKHEFGNKKGK